MKFTSCLLFDFSCYIDRVALDTLAALLKSSKCLTTRNCLAEIYMCVYKHTDVCVYRQRVDLILSLWPKQKQG